MEPKKQIEIQLGHLCNNRCLFCVSGQETALGNAGVADVGPVLAELDRARAEGHAKVTLLGGEPTLQPGFLDVVRHAARLGFEEIVVFTNGARTAREAFVDEILTASGHDGGPSKGPPTPPGRITWRISLQGATEESHERTTGKDGSFGRILRTLSILHRKGERTTVNMCVVRSNFASVAEFPALLLPFGVRQLHLDMVRPLDAGQRTEAELFAMIPRYSDMVPALTRMVEGFPEGFDVNIGNLPYCVAPHLSRFIHHDGEHTLTVAVDGGDARSAPWDKYQMKRRDKSKPESCSTCALASRCSGVFDIYRRFHGTDELQPISAAQLRAIDPEGKLLPSPPPLPSTPVARTIAVRLARLRQRAPFGALVWREVNVSEAGARAEIAFEGPAGERATVWLAEAAGKPSGGYRVDGGAATPALVEGLREIMDALRVRPGLVAGSAAS